MMSSIQKVLKIKYNIQFAALYAWIIPKVG